MHPFVAKSPREMFTQLLTQPPIALNKAAKPGLTFAPAVGGGRDEGSRQAARGPVSRARSSSPRPCVRPRRRRRERERGAPLPPRRALGGVFARVKGLFGKS